MIKSLNFAFALAATFCLAAFGWSQLATRGNGGTSSQSGGPVSPRGMVSKLSAERSFIASIGASQKQLAALDRLNEETAAAYKGLAEVEGTDKRIAKGVQIAERRALAVKNILTKEQYAKYDSWIEGNIARKTSYDPLQAHQTETTILKSLNLSSAQWEKVHALWPVLAEANHKFYRFVETDSMGSGWYSHVVTRTSVDGMKAILTKEQYVEYKKKWDQVFGISH